MSQERFEYFKNNIGANYPDDFKTFGKWLNPILRRVELTELHLEFLTRPEQANPAGIVHGGVIASIIDETIGALMVYASEPHFRASLNLNVDFISSCRPGDTLLCKAKLTKSGKTLSHATAEIIRVDDQRLIAVGSSNLIAFVR
jgi:uncharacterized protein (TIGR00369 family)